MWQKVASTAMKLINRLLLKQNDKKERYLINHFSGELRYLISSDMFAEFEMITHRNGEGDGLTADTLL